MRYIFISLIAILMLASSSFASYREAFEKEFLFKSWGGEETEVNACIDCHSSDIMKKEFQNVTESWKRSWHYQNNVLCHDCHGGDSKDATMSMSHQRGFIGTPKYTEVPEFCGKCHSKGTHKKGIPAIDMDTHGEKYVCWQCHYPHMLGGI